MAKYRNLLVAAAVVAVVLPATSLAGLFGPCGFCGLSFSSCFCPPCQMCHHAPAACACPQPVYQTGLRPVVQTQYRQEQVVTYRDVPRTEMRREAYVEQVPVTTYEQVTETVYVPQQVTRSVPRTVMQPQTRYRDIAYQVTERVAQTETRLVPQQTVGLVPEMRPVAGCNTCGAASAAFVPATVTPYPVPATVPAAVPSATIPSMPAIQVSPHGTHQHETHQHVPAYDDVEWQTIRPRNKPAPAHPTPPVRGASHFRPAPSAATVWQSRF